MSTYDFPQKVHFAHVDAAGIVFYPRYFEMLNGAVEAWWEDVLGVPFAELHLERRISIPAVHIEVDFSAPSRLGDMLTIRLTPVKLGRTSVTLTFEAVCGEERRFAGRLVFTHLDMTTGRPIAPPGDIAAAQARAAGGGDA